jgi:hypothetical protein
MLTKVDELFRSDHYYLSPTDECYFIGEYTARQGFQFSSTNDLIYNLKKKMDKRGRPEWAYKGWAIRTAAEQVMQSLNPDFLRTATFVPIPPSKVMLDPLYDDRMSQVVRLLGPETDARELVNQTQSMADAHSAEERPRPDDLYAIYRIDRALVDPKPRQLAVVDDVLTTGAHFKAMQRLLNETYPGVPLVGIFVARRVPETDPA